jgi:hypothetical protein
MSLVQRALNAATMLTIRVLTLFVFPARTSADMRWLAVLPVLHTNHPSARCFLYVLPPAAAARITLPLVDTIPVVAAARRTQGWPLADDARCSQ